MEETNFHFGLVRFLSNALQFAGTLSRYLLPDRPPFGACAGFALLEPLQLLLVGNLDRMSRDQCRNTDVGPSQGAKIQADVLRVLNLGIDHLRLGLFLVLGQLDLEVRLPDTFLGRGTNNWPDDVVFVVNELWIIVDTRQVRL